MAREDGTRRYDYLPCPTWFSFRVIREIGNNRENTQRNHEIAKSQNHDTATQRHSDIGTYIHTSTPYSTEN